MNRYLYKHKDNVSAQLNAGISAGTLSIPLKTGNGALFPTTYSGNATSAGSASTLNCTGIGATGVAVGDIIENVTDGSIAMITVVNTNSVNTTRLKGGSGNTWANTNKWAVNRFIVTLVQYDVDGVTVLKREKVLIDSRSSDTLTVNASGRGFDGSSAQSFLANDYVYLFWTSAAEDGIRQNVSQVVQDIDAHETTLASHTSSIATKASDAAVVHNTSDETIAGIKTFSSIPVLPASDPTTANQAARKAYVDAISGVLTVTAGEDVLAGQPAAIGSGSNFLASQKYGTTLVSDSFDSTNWRAQSFTSSALALYIKKLVLRLDDSGIARTITVSIRSSLAGSDIGGITATAVTGGGGPADVTFTFGTHITISPSSTYYIIVRGSAACSWSSDVNGGGDFGASSSANSGSSWSTANAKEYKYKVYEEVANSGTAYKASSLFQSDLSDNFVGFFAANASNGQQATINVLFDSNQSGLTPGSVYYLNDTKGSIGLSPGTVSRKLGLSISASKIMAKYDNP